MELLANDIRIAAGREVRNTLLARIPEDEFELLKPRLELVSFEYAALLQREAYRISSVYFLNCGIASMVVETGSGATVEVGVVGREDMIGLPLAGGVDEFTHGVMVQVAGDGFQMEARALKQALPSLPALNRLLLRQLAIRSIEVAQNAACNRLHEVKQRLARYLLLIHDRIDSDIIRTTHEFLSKMVGTGRPTITLSVAELERDGIIDCDRGSISIAKRRKLETQTCECYAVFQRFNAERGLRF